MTTKHFCDYCGEQITTWLQLKTLRISTDEPINAATYRLEHICDPCIERIKAAAPINQARDPEPGS